jgi:hypothetical protein
MKDAPVRVINTKTVTLIPTRILVREIAGDRFSEGLTEGIGEGEFSLA